jgi:hypothetical protein
VTTGECKNLIQKFFKEKSDSDFKN